jgi:trk system potassium uptake protein TrkH
MGNVLAFFLFYMLIFGSGALFLTMTGLDIVSALGASVACLSNVGPGVGIVGAMDNYSQVPLLGKWALSFLMLVGRLELFTVLLILSPAFWKKV